MTADTDEFYLVWNPNGHNPQHRHTSYESAAAEAKRLAEQNRGQSFFVLAALAFAKVRDPVEFTTINRDLIPF